MDSELFDPLVFESSEVIVSVENSANRELSRKKDKYRFQYEAELIEFNSHRLVLDTPARMCAIGHSLMVGIQTLHVNFLSTAKVIAIDNQGERDRLSVLLVQYDRDTWKKLRDSFTTKQAGIALFLKTARGI